MPKFLERKLKAEYGADSAIPYKVMNAIGAMRGSKETAKGKRMDAKHTADMKASGHHESHAYDWRSRNNLKRGR